MSQPLFHSEQLAAEWASRICDRLAEIKIPADEVEETRNIIYAFTKTAADELSRDRTISLPQMEPLEIQPAQAHEVIELFLRGVNHSAKKLRESGMSWDDRKVILEDLAWKLFNLAKILVYMFHVPHELSRNLLQSPKDLQLMMKQSADSFLQEKLTGQASQGFPFNVMPYRF